MARVAVPVPVAPDKGRTGPGGNGADGKRSRGSEQDRLAGLDGRRFRRAGEPRTPAGIPDRAGPPGARRVGSRGAPRLRPEQHPLHQRHPYRRVGSRQDDPLRPAHPWGRAARLGFRVGRQASPPLRPVAQARERQRRNDRPARRRGARSRPVRGRGQGDPPDPRRGRRGEHAARRGHPRAALHVRVAAPEDRRPRRAADHARRPPGQIARTS